VRHGVDTDTGVLPATHFAHRVLGAPAFPPPRGVGRDAECWLCGGPTWGVGWPRADALPETFTNHNRAACPSSATVCQPCVFFGHKASWEAYTAAHPEMGLKTGHAMSWRCYSHAFSGAGHECPTRGRWRALLLDPPAAPFLFVVAESGQKHILFRARVAHDRDVFPVQVEEDLVVVERERFAACLAALEALSALGFSKDSIVSGRYHAGQLLKVGLAAWRAAEDAFAPWRRTSPGLVRLAAFCGHKPELDRKGIQMP
jgi:hypothetical protein